MNTQELLASLPVTGITRIYTSDNYGLSTALSQTGKVRILPFPDPYPWNEYKECITTLLFTTIEMHKVAAHLLAKKYRVLVLSPENPDYTIEYDETSWQMESSDHPPETITAADCDAYLCMITHRIRGLMDHCSEIEDLHFEVATKPAAKSVR